VVGVIRVSSPKGQKADSQRSELEAWANRQRLKRVEWFEDRETGRHLQPDGANGTTRRGRAINHVASANATCRDRIHSEAGHPNIVLANSYPRYPR
jgi:Resolvase, N terminal domain